MLERPDNPDKSLARRVLDGVTRDPTASNKSFARLVLDDLRSDEDPLLTGRLQGSLIGLCMLALAILAWVAWHSLTFGFQTDDTRFKPVDIPMNRMYSDEWWFWLAVNFVVLCCLIAGIVYLWRRP